jgi:hypothetical protein
MDDVVFDTAITFNASDAIITPGPRAVSLLPSGAGVTVTGIVAAAAAPRDCSNVWVPFN